MWTCVKRRMAVSFRRTFAFAVSLILCLLVLASWIRSYWVRDSCTWRGPQSDHVVASTGGRIVYADNVWPNVIPVRAREWRSEVRKKDMWLEQVDHADGFHVLGFEYTHEAFPYSGPFTDSFFLPVWRLIAVPYWAPFGLLVLHPVGRLLGSLRRARRRRQLRCVQCGYDLRATPGRCPECGAATAVLGAPR